MSSDGSSPYDGWFGIGLAFIVVGVVLFVGCSILLHRVRHCQVIVKRSYFFLVVQHVGMLCYLIVINADTMTGPRHHCDFDTWIALGAFICFALPFFMRIWIYCARYYLTQERKQSGQQSTFFIKRLFLIKPSFLISVWLGILIAFTLPPLILNIISRVESYPLTMPRDQNECTLVKGLISFRIAAAYAALFVCAVIVAVGFLWKSQDAYNIKLELKLMLGLWIIIIVLTYILGAGTSFVPESYPPNVIGSIGQILTFILTGPWLLYMAYKELNLKVAPENLADKLQKPGFRRDFFDFLCLQFSVENLLFWEDVQTFKSGPITYEAAKSIFDKCILANSFAQIHF
eukprot:TRINITY_DN77_c0_g2_i3.p1 TRINITY_DN77_c0_g2~~TRINITY_DN77_c0_g2_i3.p1  ORF type:complete len:345 (+),score=12.68 TRINITY_DN77_c0_g2_i3:112-1146(+)